MPAHRWNPDPAVVDAAFAVASDIRDLARRLGVTEQTIRRWCAENGRDLTPLNASGKPRPWKKWAPDPDEFAAAFAAASSVADLANRLGVAADTMRRWCKANDVDLAPIRSPGGSPRREPGPPLPPEQAAAHDAEVLRLRSELAETKAKYKTVVRETNLHEDLLRVAREVWQPYRPAPIARPRVVDHDIVEDAILTWADWHGGEVVDFDVMLGYNAYDPAIMCRRAQYTVDRTLACLFSWHKGTRFERLWVFDLGDSVNGELRDEQKATNALGYMESCRLVAHVRARALMELAAHVPVTYVAVPGNHARLSKRVEWKRPTENGDWLIAEMVGDLTSACDRIDCVSPKSWTVGVTIRGHNHSLNHGMSATSGGFGGISWYVVQRTDGKLTALESAHGKRVHYRWYGHIHQDAKVPMMDGEGEQFIVGSLVGGDEYALHRLNANARPQQMLVGCHDDTGVSWRYPLLVGRADETPSRYESLL
jgi:transposase-like protein